MSAIAQPTSAQGLSINEQCLHCDLPIGGGARGRFCCSGCEFVYDLLGADELQRYYRLRQGPGTRISDIPRGDRDLSWLREGILTPEGATQQHLRVDIQGIHCSGCVWILEKTFNQEAGAQRLLVNPAIGSADLWFSDEFPLEKWVRSVERFGYRFGPALKSSNTRSDSLLWRLGVCVAIAFNVMLLGLALYLGLEEGHLYDIVRGASYILASVSVVVGGPTFFRSAWAGLRSRVLHLDVPISMGILLAFAGSSWAYWSGNDSAMYLDSVSVFIALMLLGRYLQERVLNANRNRILASDGTKSLRSKRIENNKAKQIPSTQIVRGDELLIAAGELLPVDSTLLSERAQISTDWINGESYPKSHACGELLQAGSFNGASQSIRVTAVQDFSASPLESLLRPSANAECGAHQSSFIRLVSSYYVAGVLVASLGGFLAWLWMTSDATLSLEVATAVLVVTCPCAFGIATPLAHELVHAKLRQEGLFVRAGDFLDRASQIRKVVFDKTGTVTRGAMVLRDDEAIAALPEADRQVLFQLCTRSAHPTSRIIAEALEGYDIQLSKEEEEGLRIEEVAGSGITGLTASGKTYKLGKSTWASEATDADRDTLFSCDGKVLARIAMREEARPDVHSEVHALQQEGYEVFLLSGDSEARVAEFSDALGLPAKHAMAERSPTEKEQWLRSHDHGDMLFVGDGINDSLAAQSATCSGTPALDRPFMASHCDFFLGTDRIEPIRSALHYSRRLAQVVRRNLAFALTYNAGAIALAWAGWMSPWLAAILMPTSSILIVMGTTLSLSRRPAWKS